MREFASTVGFGLRCPMCGGDFRRFLSTGLDHPALERLRIAGAGRRNTRCPRCGSNDRERLVYLYLVTRILGNGLCKGERRQNSNLIPNLNLNLERGSAATGGRVLHIAPEISLGAFLKELFGSGYVSADLFEGGVKVKADLANLGFRDSSFDLVVCNHVLEHVPDHIGALGEIWRVLKPGGRAILQVPISPVLRKTFEDSSATTPEARERAFGQRDHLRVYGGDYGEILRTPGFKVTEFRWVEAWGGNPASRRYGLSPHETLFAVEKPREAITRQDCQEAFRRGVSN